MTKSTVVAKTEIVREPGFLYYLDSKGNVSRIRMSSKGLGRKPYSPPETLIECNIERENEYLYFIDKCGNVSKIPYKKNRYSTPQRYWYKVYISYCHQCGQRYEYRRRQYNKKPDKPKARVCEKVVEGDLCNKCKLEGKH